MKKQIVLLSKNNTYADVITFDEWKNLFYVTYRCEIIIEKEDYAIIKVFKMNSTKLKQIINNYRAFKPVKVDKNTKGSFPNYDNYETNHTTYKCPKCNCIIHLDWHEKRNFCAECGTKLDWSDCSE